MGRTGTKVSEVSFGGIPIQTVPRSQVLAVVQRALDLGMNFVDTARAYTTSECIIGEIIKGFRSKCMIAAKTLARTADDVEKDLRTSLSELRTTGVDLCQLHNVNSEETGHHSAATIFCDDNVRE